MKTLAIANAKGGVGKTTTANSIGHGLAKRGNKILFVDLDPQGNLTESLIFQPTFHTGENDAKTVCEVLEQECETSEAIYSVTHNIDILPSDVFLQKFENQPKPFIEYRLSAALKNISEIYDYTIIDTPPATGSLTLNALFAADDVIIPATAAKFAVDGIDQLVSHIAMVNGAKSNFGGRTNILGIIVTQYQPNTNVNKTWQEIIEMVAKKYETKVFNSKIRQTVKVQEAQSKAENIFDYAKTSTAAADYDDFLNELFA